MDALCQRLDLDPLEFRKRNASVTGSTMPIGTPFPAIGLTTILDRRRRAPLLDRSAGRRAAFPAGAAWRSATGAARR